MNPPARPVVLEVRRDFTRGALPDLEGLSHAELVTLKNAVDGELRRLKKRAIDHFASLRRGTPLMTAEEFRDVNAQLRTARAHVDTLAAAIGRARAAEKAANLAASNGQAHDELWAVKDAIKALEARGELPEGAFIAVLKEAGLWARAPKEKP